MGFENWFKRAQPKEPLRPEDFPQPELQIVPVTPEQAPHGGELPPTEIGHIIDDLNEIDRDDERRKGEIDRIKRDIEKRKQMN